MAVNRSLVSYPRFADHGVRRGAVYQSPPYNHAEAWRTLLRTHRNDIAAAMKIPPEDFRWYAAFHDEGNHPHVHMMAWSVKPESGIPVQRRYTANQVHAHQPDLPSGAAARLRAEKQIARRAGVRSTKSHAGIGEGHGEMTCTLGHYYDAGFTLRTYTHATAKAGRGSTNHG